MNIQIHTTSELCATCPLKRLTLNFPPALDFAFLHNHSINIGLSLALKTRSALCLIGKHFINPQVHGLHSVNVR